VELDVRRHVMNMTLRQACRVLCFTVGPCITDASGLKLAVLITIVAAAAIHGWTDFDFE